MNDSCRRVLQREWAKANPHLPKSTSLPRLKVINPTRPIFTCPQCKFANELLPLCLWCGATSEAAAASFRASTPPLRRASSPPKVMWGGPPIYAETPRPSLDSVVSASSASTAPPLTPTDDTFPHSTMWHGTPDDLGGELSVIREITEIAEEQQRAYEKTQVKKARRRTSIAFPDQDTIRGAKDVRSRSGTVASSRSAKAAISRTTSPEPTGSRPSSPGIERPASPTLTWLIAHGGSRPRQPSQFSSFPRLHPFVDPVSEPEPDPAFVPVAQASPPPTLRRKGRLQRTVDGIIVSPVKGKPTEPATTSRVGSLSPSPLAPRNLNINATVRPRRNRPVIPVELTSEDIYRSEGSWELLPLPSTPISKQRKSLRGLKFLSSRQSSRDMTVRATSPPPTTGFSMSGEVEMRMKLAAISPEKTTARFQANVEPKPRNVIHRWFKSLRHLRPGGDT